MTIRTEPSHGDATNSREADSTRIAAAIAKAGGEWIVPSDTDFLATADNELANGPLGGFGVANTNGRTLTIATGEATFSGHYLASDDTSATDSVTGNNVHDVTIPENRNDETVYLGVDRTRTDRIIVDIAENFVLSDAKAPRVALWDVNTDSSSITATSNRRVLTRSLNLKNQRYEGGGNPVDEAQDANFLGGIQPGNFARTDETDRFLGNHYVFAPSDSTNKQPGIPEGERMHYASGTSDFLLSLQGGHGRVVWTWNAWYDGDTWRSMVSGEGHSLLGFSNGSPGPDSGGGNVVRASAPSNSNADDPISWNWRAIGEDGQLVVNGEEMTPVPERSNSPSSSAVPPGHVGMYVER